MITTTVLIENVRGACHLLVHRGPEYRSDYSGYYVQRLDQYLYEMYFSFFYEDGPDRLALKIERLIR